MHWSRPAAAAFVYLMGCMLSNRRVLNVRSSRSKGYEKAVSTLAIVHNLLLICFSAVVFVCVSRHFTNLILTVGLHEFLCAQPSVNGIAPLSGPLHEWAYIFYIS